MVNSEYGMDGPTFMPLTNDVGVEEEEEEEGGEGLSSVENSSRTSRDGAAK